MAGAGRLLGVLEKVLPTLWLSLTLVYLFLCVSPCLSASLCLPLGLSSLSLGYKQIRDFPQEVENLLAPSSQPHTNLEPSLGCGGGGSRPGEIAEGAASGRTRDGCKPSASFPEAPHPPHLSHLLLQPQTPTHCGPWPPPPPLRIAVPSSFPCASKCPPPTAPLRPTHHLGHRGPHVFLTPRPCARDSPSLCLGFLYYTMGIVGP